MFRGVVGILPLAPLTRRFVARAAGGALCGVGIATFSLLLSLHGLLAATLDEAADKAFLSWKGTAPWAAAVLAVLFMLSEIPSLAAPDIAARNTLRMPPMLDAAPCRTTRTDAGA